jgi:hypothetical protein
LNIVSSKSTDNSTTSRSSGSNNAAAWIVPTVLVLTIGLIVSFIIYHRKQNKSEAPKDLPTSNNTIESTFPPSSPSSILKLKSAQGNETNNNTKTTATSFHAKSIDLLLQEFAQDDKSLISDPSTNDNDSEYSCFSGLSDLDLKDTKTKTLRLQDAALTSCTLHNPREISKHDTNYLPCALQKQESFENKYRTISAMASVLRKDILHVAGETGEDSPSSTKGNNHNKRTSSPKKCMEMMERQKMRERELMRGGDVALERGEGSEGRVGIRPAN